MKKQEPDTNMKNRKEGSKKNNKRDTKKETVKKEEAQKWIKRNKGRHRQKYTKHALFGRGNRVFSSKSKDKETKK